METLDHAVVIGRADLGLTRASATGEDDGADHVEMTPQPEAQLEVRIGLGLLSGHSI
jgi:hypothetical protein